MLVHDEHIGVGSVHHLFRLPEDMEQAVHQLGQTSMFTEECNALLSNKETALDYLTRNASGIDSQNVASTFQGPIRIADVAAMRTSDTWPGLSACYAQAFATDAPTYPYWYQPT